MRQGDRSWFILNYHEIDPPHKACVGNREIMVDRLFSSHEAIKVYSGDLNAFDSPGGGKALLHKGIILGGSLTGPKARVLLLLAVDSAFTMAEIRDIFKNA